MIPGTAPAATVTARPEAAFTGVVTKWSIALDASTSTGYGSNPVELVRWKDADANILGYGETITLDFTGDGISPDDVVIALEVYSRGVWSSAVGDVFTLDPPGDDYIFLGSPTYLEENITDVRFTIPITATTNLSAPLVSPDTVELTILADGVAIYGPSIKTWGLDLATITDAAGILPEGTLANGGSLSFDSRGPGDEEYTVQMTTQGVNSETHSVTFANPHNLIYRAGGAPGTSISTGAWQINTNITNLDWTDTDVQKYHYAQFQSLQRSRINDWPGGDIDVYGATAIDALYNTNSTVTLSLAQLRYDLCWYGDVSQVRPLEAWGSAEFPFPTAAMGQDVRSGETWQECVDFMTTQGYVQDPANAALTGNITFPYNLSLEIDGGGTGIHYWRVRINKMKHNDSLWLNHIATAAAKWRDNFGDINDTPATGPRVAGFIIAPHKIQWGNPAVLGNVPIFQDWVFNGGNPMWSITDNDHGTLEIGTTTYASWPDNSETYAQYDDNILDIVEGSWKMAEALSIADPTSVILYDPISLHVPWSSTLRTYWETQCLAEYGMTPTQAREYYRDRTYEIARIPNVYYLQARELDSSFDDSVAEIGQDYLTLSERNDLRDLTSSRMVVYPRKIQTTL